MDVYHAVTSRRAVRSFTDEPVSRTLLEQVLSAATRAPSGANLRPWNAYVVTGAPMAELKKRTAERVAAGDRGDAREYRMYPPTSTGRTPNVDSPPPSSAIRLSG